MIEAGGDDTYTQLITIEDKVAGDIKPAHTAFSVALLSSLEREGIKSAFWERVMNHDADSRHLCKTVRAPLNYFMLTGEESPQLKHSQYM